MSRARSIQPRTGGRLALGAVAAFGALLLTLTGCSREFTPTGAVAVEGFDGLFRSCDGPVLIYYSSRAGSSDAIEGMFYGVPECTGEATDEPQPNGQ